MRARNKTNSKIQTELEKLRQRVSELEKLESQYKGKEEVIRESEERFKGLFDHASDPIFIHDLEGHFLEVNRVTCEGLGYGREELLKMTTSDIETPERASLTPERIEELSQKGRIFFETAHVTKDRRVIPVELNCKIIELKGKQAVLCIARDITKRRQTEKTLRESEEKYSNLFHHSNDAIFIHDFDGNIIDVNQRGLDLFGYTKAEVSSLTIPELHPPEALETSKWAFETISRDGFVNFEIDFKKKSGDIFPAEVSASLFEVGEESVIQGIVRDITEKKRAEEKLRESEELYRTLVLTSPEAVTLTDLEGNITYVSKQTLELHGFENAEEMLGKNALELIEPEDHEKAMAYLKKTLEEGFVRNVEYRLLRKDGTRFFGELSAALIRDGYGKPKAFIATVRDITDRKREEERIRESEEKYRTLVEQLLQGLVIIQDYRIVYANTAMAEILGYTVEEILALSTEEIQASVHPDDRDLLWKRFEERIAGKPISPRYELRVIMKDGQSRWLEIYATRIEYHGRPAIQATFIDITERRVLEEQLRQVQKMEAVGTLAGGVAHDFNNLLIGITGYSDLLLSRLGEEDPMRKDILEIKNAAKRATSLTKQLLAFGRRQMLQMRVIDLNDVVSNMDTMLRRLIGENIELVSILRPKLKPVKADPSQMELVIMNLVINARDAMPEGGKLTVKTENVTLDEESCRAISEARAGDFVCLTVSDTGIGMDMETLERIYEPFFSTKEMGRGTGLGLSTVYGSVKQHNGWITVNSKREKGTTFKIFLPVTSEKLDDGAERDTSVTKLRGKGERILLVEDDERVRNFMAKVLSSNGYEVAEAENTEKGVEIFKREQGNFDVLFSDVILPGKTGLKLVDELLSLKPELKVILSSGYTEQQSQWKQIEERGFHFIQKPFTMIDILKTVREVIGSN